MSDTAVAKIVKHGRSQSIRMPAAFRLPGDRVRVRRVKDGILLQPIATDVDAWLAEINRLSHIPFMPEGRQQPPMPPPKDLFE